MNNIQPPGRTEAEGQQQAPAVKQHGWPSFRSALGVAFGCAVVSGLVAGAANDRELIQTIVAVVGAAGYTLWYRKT